MDSSWMCYSLENSESVRGNSFYIVNQNTGFNDAFYLESLLQHLTLHSWSTAITGLGKTNKKGTAK